MVSVQIQRYEEINPAPLHLQSPISWIADGYEEEYKNKARRCFDFFHMWATINLCW